MQNREFAKNVYSGIFLACGHDDAGGAAELSRSYNSADAVISSGLFWPRLGSAPECHGHASRVV
jgi:hypothetical protein